MRLPIKLLLVIEFLGCVTGVKRRLLTKFDPTRNVYLEF